MKIAFIHSEKKIGTGAHHINDLMARKLRASGVQVKNFYPKNPLLDAPVHLKGLSNVLFFYSLLENRDQILKCNLIQGTTYTPLAFLPFIIPVVSHFGSTSKGFLRSVPLAKDLDNSLRAVWVKLKREKVLTELNIKTRRPLRDVAEVEQLVARKADCLIATSQIVRQDLLKMGATPQNIFVVPNAIEDYWFQSNIKTCCSKTPSICFLGRLGSDVFTLKLKGLDRLIDVYEAFPAVQKCTIAMTANLALVEWMNTSIAEHQFFVNTKKQEIPKILQDHMGDILFIPSRYEGFSLSLIEGMSQGLIPVVYHVGIAPEIIKQGKNGFLVRSQREAKKAIKDILSMSTVERKRIAKQAQRTTQKFSSDRIAQELIAVYSKTKQCKKKMLARFLERLSNRFSKE